MKLKTTELIGAALDWTVGDIEFARLISQGSHVKQWVMDDHKAGWRTDPYSVDWLFGGPIIERERIVAQPLRFVGQTECGTGVDEMRGWKAHKASRFYWVTPAAYAGDTLLIAAMRCFVASKLGDEVDVPEELCAS